MAWAEQLKSKKWRGGWWDTNGKKHYTRRPEFPLHPYDYKSDALVAAQEAEVRARRVAAADQGTLAASITWGAWWDQSRQDRPDSDTCRNECNIVEKYLRPKWGNTPLNQITRKMIQRWVTDELTPGKAASYTCRIYAVFRSSLSRALDQEILDATPCVRIKLPTIRKKPKPYVDQPGLDALTQPADGVMALRDPGHRALIAVAYETGLRPGELCGMHVDQVDLDTGWIEVTHVYVQRRKVIRGWPKDKDYRRVPLTSAAVAILRPLLAQRGTQGCGVPHTDGAECKSDLVFRSQRGSLITQDALQQALPQAAKRAGVAPKSPYALRRGAFTWMAEGGVDAFTIAAIAGHASLDQTAEYVQETQAARGRLRAARGEAPGLTVIQGSKQAPPEEDLTIRQTGV